MAFAIDLNDTDSSITLSNGENFKINEIDFSIVVEWPGDTVKFIKINGQEFVQNTSTGAKARTR